ncbi:restriction endonuclease [Candidatus Bathyarchaeota archaeon]|nr:restriction endonuclease [Candidatus Bathyarchaeota archaeon]
MSQHSLIKLAMRYFTRRGYTVDREFGKEEDDAPARKFDFVVRKGSEIYPVWVKDWNRTVGVNVVISVDKASRDIGLFNPILVANKFSEHARAYANRKGIRLVAKSDILREVRAL